MSKEAKNSAHQRMTYRLITVEIEIPADTPEDVIQKAAQEIGNGDSRKAIQMLGGDASVTDCWVNTSDGEDE